jgi:hypothetical protein
MRGTFNCWNLYNYGFSPTFSSISRDKKSLFFHRTLSHLYTKIYSTYTRHFRKMNQHIIIISALVIIHHELRWHSSTKLYTSRHMFGKKKKLYWLPTSVTITFFQPTGYERNIRRTNEKKTLNNNHIQKKIKTTVI